MSREALSRLQKEFRGITKEPVPNAVTVPDPKNWLRWHYVIYGLEGPFAGGIYHGELLFPASYPMGPPSIKMFTPNGRFIQNHKICTSMSDFHPESWTPIWNVGTIITGLISFMQEDERSTGCEATTYSQKAYLAKSSMGFNMANPVFTNIFEDHIKFLEKFKFQEASQASEGIPVSPASRKPWKAVLAFIILLYLLGQVFIRS